jgi:hypothetical protein
MPERVDHARTRPYQSSNVALIAYGGEPPAGTASAAASGRAGSSVEIRPLRRMRSAVRAMPGRVAAAVAMAVLGEGRFSVNFMRRFARVPAWLLARDVRRPTAG